jgi:hypothetical protein
MWPSDIQGMEDDSESLTGDPTGKRKELFHFASTEANSSSYPSSANGFHDDWHSLVQGPQMTQESHDKEQAQIYAHPEYSSPYCNYESQIEMKVEPHPREHIHYFTTIEHGQQEQAFASKSMGMPTIPSEEGTSTDEAGTETPVATRVPKKGTVSRREMVTKLEECAKVAEAKINNERKGISEHADKESDEKTITLGMATLNLMCNSTVHPLVTDIAGVPTVEPCEVQQEGKSESEMMSSSVLGAGSWIQEPENNATSQANGNVLKLASIDRPPPVLTGLFGEDWQSTLRACPGGPTESSSTPSNGPGGGSSQSDLPGNAGSPTNGRGRSQKRLSEEGGGSGEGDDPDLSKKAKFEKRLACPIWRKDPHYYQTSHLHKSKYTNCAAGMGFDGISRLKSNILLLMCD